MEARRVLLWAVLAVGFVWFSSLLGLAKAMRDLDDPSGFDLFVEVWSASLWGDIVFVVGTIALGAAAWWFSWSSEAKGRAPWVLALPLLGGLLGHWAVYMVAWALTFPNMGDEAVRFLDWGWDWSYDPCFSGTCSSPSLTWRWGRSGILLAAAVPPLAAWFASWRGLKI